MAATTCCHPEQGQGLMQMQSQGRAPPRREENGQQCSQRCDVRVGPLLGMEEQDGEPLLEAREQALISGLVWSGAQEGIFRGSHSGVGCREGRRGCTRS